MGSAEKLYSGQRGAMESVFSTALTLMIKVIAPHSGFERLIFRGKWRPWVSYFSPNSI